jgi:dTDP-4-dehydrorhamnose reductase
MKKVLFVGGSSLLAINWAQLIKARYRPVLNIHKRSIALPSIDTCQLNLMNSEVLALQIASINPSFIVNAAALANVDLCESNEQGAIASNVFVAEVVAAASNKLNIPLIHVSTDQIFDGKIAFANEMSKPNPLNIYGKTKLDGEIQVVKSNPRSLIIRTNFYGWGPLFRQSFSDYIIHSLRNAREIYLHNDVHYTPILIESLVKCVHSLIELNAVGIYHIVGNERITKYDFGVKLAQRFDLDANYIKGRAYKNQINTDNAIVHRPLDMSLSNKKLMNLIPTDFIGSIDEQLAILLLQENSTETLQIRSLN